MIRSIKYPLATHRQGWTLSSSLVVALGVALTACSNGTGTAQGQNLQVATTTNISADWARQVGGEHVEVFSLVPTGKDPHAYQPGAQDIARVADADLVLSIGLGLEANWLNKLVQNAAAAGPSRVVALGEAVDPLTGNHGAEGPGEEDRGGESEGHHSGPADPHFWFDVARAQEAVSEIAAHFARLDAANEVDYERNADAYLRRLDELDAWIHARADSIPADRRLLVTSHDSFRYFAERYGFTIVGTVIPGITTEREPSAAELRALIEQVRDRGAPAIFTERSVSDRLARTIAEETGAAVVTGLYTGSLGTAASGADNYIGMIRTNVRTIVEALR